MNLDLHSLRAFYVLSKTLSFTRTAKSLYITQSAVSHAIKKLEESCGIQLTSRQGRAVFLTQAGKDLAQSCQIIFGEVARVENSMLSYGNMIQTIKIGVTVEFGISVLMRNIRPFLEHNKDIHLDFHFSFSLLPYLINDELDIIIDCKDHAYPGLEKIVLFREHYAVVAAPAFMKDHPIKKPKDLEGKKILSQDKGMSWWDNFVQTLPAAERPVFKYDDIIEIDHVRGMINAAQESLGIAFLPKYSIIKEMKRRALVDVFPGMSIREDQFCIYQKKRKAQLDAHKRLVDYLTGIRPAEFG